MIHRKDWSRFLGVAALASFLTVTLGFIGAPFLRVLRNVYGPTRYWITGLLISVLVFSVPDLRLIAFMVLAGWITVGIYSEFEENGRANFWTAIISLGLGSFVMICVPVALARFAGDDLIYHFRKLIETLLTQAKVDPKKVSAELILQQAPSVLILLQAMSLAFALMWERKAALLVGLPFEKIASQMRLYEFKMPDSMIWVTMLSFLLSFIKLDNHIATVIASNLFNVMLGLYFFQGLAVMEVGFLVYKVGSFVRFLIYLLIVGQLFLLLSAVGIIDFWVDFRKRLRNRKAPETNQKNGEQI